MTTSDDNLILAADNPALANEVAAIAMTSDPPAYSPSEDGPVTLPGGFRRYTGPNALPEDTTTAWVKELTGFDEEQVAKARNKQSLTVLVDALLEGGVEKLGEEAPKTRDLQELLSGDRDYLLMEISRATYGDLLEYEDFVCMFCGEKFSFQFNKSEDIPVKKLASLDDAEFEVELRKGKKAVVRLATGKEEAKTEKGTTIAEKNTILLIECVSEIRNPNGSVIRISDQPSAIRKLGVVDRQTILKEMAERSPGPQYNEVSVTDPNCGNEIKVAVTFTDLFPGM